MEDLMENGIEFFLKDFKNETAVETHNHSVLEHLYANTKIHIGRYKLSKDSFFYTSSASDSDSVKTYVVLSGSLKELRTQNILKTGDVFVIGSQAETHAFYNLEESLILCHEQSSKSLDNMIVSTDKMSTMLSELQEKDHYTKDHSERVFQFAKHMGLALNYHSMQMYNLNKASRFHDIGKIYIDDNILNKAGQLTETEFESMKEHTSHCKDLILEKYSEDIYKIISQHHERLNGCGYPLGLKSEEICEEAKIIAICDSYDAMTTDRIYKTGKSKEEAFKELRDLSDTHYDKRLVELFIKINSEQ